MSGRPVKRIAVIGGGPGGSFAAARLAADFQVALFDEKLAWEKPCGGGVTAKAVRRYPLLQENTRPKRVVREAVFSAPGAAGVRLLLPDPVLVYSRYDLNGLLLEHAAAAGCELVQDRISGLRRAASGWLLEGRAASYEADFVVLACGVRTPFRELTGPLRGSDVGTAFGYLVPGSQAYLEIGFLKDFEGYVWVFPRPDHLSAGICTKLASEPAPVSRERLHRFMEERGISRSGARFYSHLLPLPSVDTFREQRVAGEGWAAVGDAAALVDPITGEGIYYALRSAELLAESMLAGQTTEYARRVREECIADLEFAARVSHRFYRGEYFGAPVTTRLVQLARHSRLVRGVLGDLVSGAQPYRELKQRLKSIAVPAAREVAGSVLGGVFRRRAPEPRLSGTAR